MGRIVACSHCGAPHRQARGQTRGTCPWCGGENVAAPDSGAEELVVEGRVDARRACRRAEALLERRGVRGARVTAGAPRWIAQWQIVGEDGDTVVRSATPSPSRLEASLDLPTAAFRPVDAGDLPPRGLPDREPPGVDADEALRAARAGFRRTDQPIAALRLVWTPVCSLRVRVPGGTVEGLYRGGADEVLFGPLPAGAIVPPVDGAALATFAIFAATAWVVGVTVDDPVVRAAVLAAATAAVVFARPAVLARPGGRRS